MKKRLNDHKIVDPIPGSPVLIFDLNDNRDLRTLGCMFIATGGWGAVGAAVGQTVYGVWEQ